MRGRVGQSTYSEHEWPAAAQPPNRTRVSPLSRARAASHGVAGIMAIAVSMLTTACDRRPDFTCDAELPVLVADTSWLAPQDQEPLLPQGTFRWSTDRRQCPLEGQTRVETNSLGFAGGQAPDGLPATLDVFIHAAPDATVAVAGVWPGAGAVTKRSTGPEGSTVTEWDYGARFYVWPSPRHEGFSKIVCGRWNESPSSTIRVNRCDGYFVNSPQTYVRVVFNEYDWPIDRSADLYGVTLRFMKSISQGK